MASKTLDLKFFILALLAGCLLLGLTSDSAQAQITKTARVELSDTTSSVYIGPQLYLTLDPEKKLTYQTVVSRHENNLRGAREDSTLINPGLSAPALWMVFSVTNNSQNNDWVLHFGKLLDGRMALAHKILVRNHTRGETFARALREKDGEAIHQGAFGDDLQGPALPIKIGRGQTELFVVYMEAEGGLPNTFKPRLMTAKSYMSMLRFGDIWSALAGIFFVSMMGFFIAVSYMRQDPKYMLFFGYYALNACLFYLLNNSFFASFSLLGEFLFLLYAGSVLLGLAMTKLFFDITVEEHTVNSTIISTSGALIFLNLANIALFSEANILDDVLVFVPPALAMLLIIGLSFLQGQKGKFAAPYYASAWVAVFLGSLITALSATDIISSNTFFMNAYWISLLPQAFFFIIGTSKKIQLSEQEQRHLRSRENRAAYSLARLQQSKESADQARLLRVIERERELMAELREREMQRTEEMRRAKIMADEANRAKSAFLAVVSHEIRTPMTGILGMVRLLMETKLSKEQTDYSVAIQKSGDTMMALLNDILDFEKIESGNMDLEEIEFDLPRLVQDVVTLMSGHAMGKNITLDDNISENFPRALIGDPTRLRQIILNLTSNAIKFTENGDVTIHLRATKLQNKPGNIKGDYEVYVAVEDSGIGIPEDVQANLFNPFSQADKSTSRKYGGTGLGLAICKRLVEAMGSAVHVTSEEGKGSTFFFSLLMEEGENTQADLDGDDTDEHIELPPMHILVIEDNEMNRKVLQGFLENAGHTATLCESGEHALEIIDTRKFDAIFTDIGLQGMDGLETAKTIRSLPDRSIANLPIIAITGNVGREDIETYYRNGMNGFIGKPISPEEIHTALVQIHTGTLENPVSHSPAQHPNQPRKEMQPPQAASDNDRALSADNNISPLQAYAQTHPVTKQPSIDKNEDFDSFAQAIEEEDDQDGEINAALPEHTIQIFDVGMLETLLSSLGQEPFQELIQSCLEKADEIITGLEELREHGSIEDIRDRAHELKGMTANFGMSELADISGAAEDAAKDKRRDIALSEMEKLPDANRRAKEAINQWLTEKD